MKSLFVCIATLFVCFSECVWASPNTLTLLKEQTDAIKIKKIEDIAHDKTVFQIEICPTNACDMFESAGTASLSRLTDYVYLYSVYEAKYVDFSAPGQGGGYQPMTFILKATTKGYAEEVLEQYIPQFNCTNSANKATCVIQALQKSASIKQFKVNYDEQTRTQIAVSGDHNS